MLSSQSPPALETFTLTAKVFLWPWAVSVAAAALTWGYTATYLFKSPKCSVLISFIFKSYFCTVYVQLCLTVPDFIVRLMSSLLSELSKHARFLCSCVTCWCMWECVFASHCSEVVPRQVLILGSRLWSWHPTSCCSFPHLSYFTTCLEPDAVLKPL